MGQIPTIGTHRLILRSFALDDVPGLQRWAGEKELTSTTSDSEIPQPGREDQWIRLRQDRFASGESIDFAIVHRKERSVIGAIGLGVEYKKEKEIMQLGFWIGKPYWNQGYCTEAAEAVLQYGFDVMGLHRIFSGHFASNPASGRVLQKIGMKYEGTLRESYNKLGKFEDVVRYGLLRTDYTGSR